MKVLIPSGQSRPPEIAESPLVAPSVAAPVPAPPPVPPVAGPSTAAVNAISRPRFFGNLGLLIAAVIVLCLWFQRHLQEHVNASRLIGGTLSLWALFELIKGCIDWAAEDEMKALPQRVLGSRHSTGYLGLALVVGVLLHACTSSIWIEYEVADQAAASYKVEVRYDQPGRLPFIEPLTVTSAQPMAGHTFFFRGRTTPLRFEVASPRGFAAVPGRLGWGERRLLTVPAELQRKQYRLLRLLPTPEVMNRLEEVGGAGPARYALELAWNGRTTVIGDVRRQVVYLGADAAEMDDVIADEAADVRLETWHALLHRAGMPPEQREPLLAAWNARPALRTTPEFGPGTKVQVRIFRRRDGETVAQATATLDPDHVITSILLSRPEP